MTSFLFLVLELAIVWWAGHALNVPVGQELTDQSQRSQLAIVARFIEDSNFRGRPGFASSREVSE
jgi:hypothetical protein